MNNLSSFIKFQRKKFHLTQEELADKAGVGIRFIRDMEQGKETLQMDKVNQVLSLFGYSLVPERQKIDPYDILWNYFGVEVKITLKNKLERFGFIMSDYSDKTESKEWAWQFLPKNKALAYQQTEDVKLFEVILHKDILEIEEQKGHLNFK